MCTVPLHSLALKNYITIKNICVCTKKVTPNLIKKKMKESWEKLDKTFQSGTCMCSRDTGSWLHLFTLVCNPFFFSLGKLSLCLRLSVESSLAEKEEEKKWGSCQQADAFSFSSTAQCQGQLGNVEIRYVSGPCDFSSFSSNFSGWPDKP